MRRRQSLIGWLILAAGILIAAAGLSQLWEFRQAYLFVAEMEAKGAHLLKQNRGPEWLVDWAAKCNLSKYASWFESDLDYLADLPADFSDRDMQRLRLHPRLRFLAIENTAVTDRGIAVLHTLPKLTGLHLKRVQITDEGLQTIAKLPNLESLLLEKTQVTNQGLAALAATPSLSWLSLDFEITDNGLQNIAKARGLKTLLMERTNTTDVGLTHLKLLPNLEWIILDGECITDESLKILATFPALKSLGLNHTRVTLAGMKWLHKQSPALITGGGPDDVERSRAEYLDSLPDSYKSATPIIVPPLAPEE